jgi:hypothetical protein
MRSPYLFWIRHRPISLAPNTRANIACTAPTAVADLSPDQPVAGDPSISVTFPHQHWADPLQLDQHLCDLIGLR